MQPRSFVRKRNHFKSRNGCVECKKRKVKCDESREGCSSCFKRRTTCSLIAVAPPPLYTNPQPQSTVPMPLLNVLDLELLHNYSTKTCLSMESRADIQEFYRTSFISEALKSDFVLHCLLGLSAFHLVQQHQELLQRASEDQRPRISSKIDEYLFAAHVHHNAGISSFRQTLTNINEDNCHSLFAAASLIVMTSFAVSCEGVRCFTESRTPSHEEVTRWLILLRGVKTVLTQGWEWVIAGPLAPILVRRGLEDYGSTDAAMDSDAADYLDRLTTAFGQYSEPEVVQICMSEIETLRKTWREISNGCDFAVAFVWVVGLDNKFMALLEMKRSEALLVLAAYCVLLHSANHWRWWMQGWPRNMLTAVEMLIDEPWKGWLQWPAQIIGDDTIGLWREHILIVTEGMCCQ